MSMVERLRDAIIKADDAAVMNEMEPASFEWAEYLAIAALMEGEGKK